MPTVAGTKTLKKYIGKWVVLFYVEYGFVKTEAGFLTEVTRHNVEVRNKKGVGFGCPFKGDNVGIRMITDGEEKVLYLNSAVVPSR